VSEEKVKKVLYWTRMGLGAALGALVAIIPISNPLRVLWIAMLVYILSMAIADFVLLRKRLVLPGQTHKLWATGLFAYIASFLFFSTVVYTALRGFP